MKNVFGVNMSKYKIPACAKIVVPALPRNNPTRDENAQIRRAALSAMFAIWWAHSVGAYTEDLEIEFRQYFNAYFGTSY